MKISFYAGAMLASALALAACNSGGDKGGNAASSGASNAAAPAGNTSGGEAPAGNESAGGGEQASGSGARQDFSIVNNTGQAVMTLNVSPTSEEQWGPDILGRDVLANGETAQIQFERGESQCNWDIRVTYEDGDTGDWRNVNLCETATVTLTAE